MSTQFRLAITADLHWGLQAGGDAATRQLINFLRAQRPDIVVVGGDVGTQHHFEECLALFDSLSTRKVLVPGNHDIWVEPGAQHGDSLSLYDNQLPRICEQHGFGYLDQKPVILPEVSLGIVGSINWYDYSWSIDRLKSATPRWEYHLTHKVFTRGRHNDANFVRWNLTDQQFTERVVARLRQHVEESLAVVQKLLVITHHPCFYGLNFPRQEPLSVDGLLWDAFSGNRSMEALLLEHQARIPLVFSGHTHRARESMLGEIRGYNIGGDYHFKRLLMVDWPEGTVQAREFYP